MLCAVGAAPIVIKRISFPRRRNRTVSNPRLSDVRVPDLEAGLLAQLRQILNGYMAGDVLSPHYQILNRLFSLGEPVAAEQAARAFRPLELAALIAAGLLAHRGEETVSLFSARVHDGRVCLADIVGGETPADFVLPIGPSAKHLAGLTLRAPVDSALDLGCGCGIQALLLARHARHVTATDINPRALALTRLNARLNGVENIEVLPGNYFEPVRGRTFDLIVANTPYVITPGARHVYRDAADPLDQSALNLIRQAPDFLKEGGHAHLLATWLHKEHADPAEPIRALVDSMPVDALLVHSFSNTPGQYADDWIPDEFRHSPLLFAWTKFRWLAWYRRMGAQRFAFGAINLRRRSAARNWFHAVQARHMKGHSNGSHVASLFHAQDYLNHYPDPRDLLDKILVPSNLTIQADETGDVRLVKIVNGLVIPARITPTLGQVLYHLGEGVIVETAIRRALQETGQDILEPRINLLGELQHLLRLGFIRSADPPRTRRQGPARGL
jgi:SAM-dependent methyltransferase